MTVCAPPTSTPPADATSQNDALHPYRHELLDVPAVSESHRGNHPVDLHDGAAGWPGFGVFDKPKRGLGGPVGMVPPVLVWLRAAATGAAKWLGLRGWEEARRIHAQREAASGDRPPDNDRVGTCLNETIGAVTGRSTEPSWWATAAAMLRQRGIDPDPMFRGESLYPWLDDPMVRRLLRGLASRQLSGDATEMQRQADYDQLAKLYEDKIGDVGSSSRGKIDQILAVMMAGLQYDLARDSAVSALSVQLQASTASTLDLIDRRLPPSPGATGSGVTLLAGFNPQTDLLVQACRETCESQLRRILQRRCLPNANARGEIAELAALVVDGGELALCPTDTRALIFAWAARLHAPESTLGASANKYRELLLRADPAADTRIIDAWLDMARGDQQSALSRVRDVESPDARSTLMALIRTSHGVEAAIRWYEAQPKGSIALLTGVGWRQAAVTLAEGGRWESAVEAIDGLPDSVIDECPDIPYVDGVLTAALLCPSDLRRHILNMELAVTPILQEGEVADRHRRRALESFQRASHEMHRLGEEERAHAADRAQTWLRLTDKRTRAAAVAELEKAMASGSTAIDAIELACVANINFNVEPLENYLRSREISAPLDPPELGAKFALYRYRKTRAQLIAFLEQYAVELEKIFAPGARSAFLISALADEGQFERAWVLLRENQIVLGRDFDRLSDYIRNREGYDVLPSLEARFAETGSLVDLLPIWDHVVRGGDFEKVQKYGKELFQRQRTKQNAHNVSAALNNLGRFDELVSFLDGCDEFVVANVELGILKAWALFHRGRLHEAQEMLARLPTDYASPDRLSLEINLAIGLAHWELFPAIIDRGWHQRSDWPARTMLQLSLICVETDRERAIELAQLAVAKAPTDPNVLAGAYLLMVKAEREDLGAPWMQQAAELSGADGPVRSGTIEEAVSMVTDGFTRSREINRAVSEGKLPLHVAATVLNVPISRFLIVEAGHNARQPDWRRRSIIPFRHGGRLYHDMQPVRVITADLASLIILSDFDLLELLSARFDNVRVPWSTTYALLTEVRDCEFHQPSRITAALQLLGLASGQTPKIRPLPLDQQPPDWLVQEVGNELADLLEAARQTGGRLLRPLPIFRVGSQMRQQAGLREYAPLVVTTIELATQMREAGILDAEKLASAMTYLRRVDVAGAVSRDLPFGGGGLYVDSLAVTYLTVTDLLGYLPRVSSDLYVHTDTLTEAENLVATKDDTARALNVLTRLRAWLRGGLESGAITILASREGAIERDFPSPLLREVLENPGDSQAVLLDDRTLGQLGWLTDVQGRNIPLIGFVDLARDLVRAGHLDQARQWAIHRALRERGFSGIPLELDELEHWLSGASIDPVAGTIRETAELKTLKEYFLRLRSTTFLQQPAETSYLDRVRLAGVAAIRRAWSDVNLTVDVASARATWLYEYIVPSTIDWRHTIVEPASVVPVADGLLNQIVSLLPPVVPDIHRAAVYADWLDQVVLRSVLRACPSAIQRVAELGKRAIAEWTQRFPDAQSGEIASIFVRMAPANVRRYIVEDEAFTDQLGINTEAWVSLAGSPHVKRDELWGVTRAVYADGKSRTLTGRSGSAVTVSIIEGRAFMTFAGTQGERQSVPPIQLRLLSPVEADRLNAVAALCDTFGPTGPAKATWIAIASQRPLDDDDFERLSAEIDGSVPSYLNRITLALTAGQVSLDVLVPMDLRYYEALCGARPSRVSGGDDPFDALRKHRQGLMDRDALAGLQLCLPMTLRDDFSCVPLWQRSADELWIGLSQTDFDGDPMSQLAVLDLAIAHIVDSRFDTLANQVIERLCGPTLLRSDGVDLYDLFAALLQLIDDRVRLIPGVDEEPVLWRRMCSWTHAAMVCQILREAELPPDFLPWCTSQSLESSKLARLYELRDAPASQPGDVSPRQIRSEILGRMEHLRERYGKQVFPAHGSELLDHALQELSVPGSYRFPGPLEGQARPQTDTRQLPEELYSAVTAAVERLTPDLSDPEWFRLTFYARFWRLDEELRSRCLGLLSQADTGDVRRLLMMATGLGYMALGQDWPELARTMLALWRSWIGGFQLEADIVSAIRVLLILTSALPEPEARSALEDCLAEFAARREDIPGRLTLLRQLKLVREVIPPALWNLGRVEALCVL